MTRLGHRGRDAGSTLAPLASESVAPPDAAFTDVLEQRLRAVHALREAGAPAAPSAWRRWVGTAPAARRAGWLAPAALAAAGVAGAVVLAGGSNGPRPTGPTIEVARAVDAQAIAPGGQAMTLVAGARLPDGTIVRTGPAGQVRADGGFLGPDGEAVVHGGHLTVLVPKGHPAPSSRPGGAGTSPGAPSPAPPGHEEEHPGPAPATTSHPSPSDGGSKPSNGHDHGAAPAPPAGSSMHLSVRHGQQHAGQLTWSGYEGSNLYGYVVLRSTPPADPAYPRDAIHFTPATGPLTFTDTPSGGAEYQIVAIDSTGGILATSNVDR